VLDKIMKRIPTLWMIAIWFICLRLSFFYTASFTTAVDIENIMISRIILSVGIAFYLTPLVALSHRNIPEAQLSEATGLFHFFRIFAGGAGTSLAVYLWDRRATTHRIHLTEFTNVYQENTVEVLHLLDKAGLPHEQGLEVLSNMTDNQAYMLATNDLSLLSGALILSLTLLLFFCKRKARVPA
jgi:MFS transporter, DHA2 family, multidrug resistance protein